MTGTKRCNCCGKVKPLEAFCKRKNSKDGRNYRCRECDAAKVRAHYNENKEQRLAQRKTYYEANKERELARYKAYYEANKEQEQARVKAYDKANRPRHNAHNSARRAGLKRATPAWLTQEHKDAEFEIYASVDLFDDSFGEPYQVDHRVPLKNKIVCGLHVPWNLLVITAKDNLSKNNSFDPNDPDNVDRSAPGFVKRNYLKEEA